MTKITKKQLEKKYLKEGLSQQQIAISINCSQTYISKLLVKYNIPKRKYREFVDITGKKFFNFTVIRRINKPGRSLWKCLCTCGNIRNVDGADLKSGNHKSCGRCHFHKFIQDSWWGEIQKQAKRRNLEFGITKDYLYKLWNKQSGKCAISGIELNMPKKARDQRGPLCTASIDRIDNGLGYINGNIQWVHKDVNRMRREYSMEKYIEICKKVAENNRGVLCELS